MSNFFHSFFLRFYYCFRRFSDLSRKVFIILLSGFTIFSDSTAQNLTQHSEGINYVVSINSEKIETTSGLQKKRFFGLYGLTGSEHHLHHLVNNEVREKWIHTTSNKIKSRKDFESFPELLFSEIDTDTYYQKGLRVQEKGKVIFPDNSHLIIICHSSHSNPEVGDVTIAIDQNNKMFINKGHICGGIIHFISSKKSNVSTVNDFVNNFHSDTDDLYWEEIAIKNK